MNKPHKWEELIKAWADGAEIQFCSLRWPVKEWLCVIDHQWNNQDYEFRLKPQPKPDVVRVVQVTGDEEGNIHMNISGLAASVALSGTFKIAFDAETGQLKSAEVLK